MSANRSMVSAPSTGTPVSRKYSVPIQMTDLSTYDDAYAAMKERVAAEMRRIDAEMSKFSTDLLRLYGQTSSVQSGLPSSKESQATNWDVITKSPLVEGEGNDRALKLQFDLGNYNPNEVSVKVLNNMLIVSAAHQEKTADSTASSEYSREFLLPLGTDPETVQSALSKDGILTVRVPLRIESPDSASATVKLNQSVLSERD